MTRLMISLIALVFAIPVFSQVSVAPLDIKTRTLANGLQFVSVRDKANPVVTVQVWYRVGGKDDPEGKSGFAHMFEHMMFKATKNMPNEKMDRLTEDVGGWNNASTRDDLTNYYEVVPSNYLESLLWAEAERMVNLSVDEKNFASERNVVKEEYRQSVLANPYGRLFQYLDSLTFKVHPYKRGVIGNLDELNAATLEDAFAFYREYYRPDNASLIVVGDFEQKQLDEWVDKYFGRVKKPAGEIKRVTAEEPDKTEVARFDMKAPNVPLPALGMTYLAPVSTSPDIPALEIAESILSGGESSRLYQEIVYKKQLAADVSLFTDFRTEKGLLAFFAVAAGGKKLEDIESSILGEVKKLQESPPTAREMEKAKNSLITGILRSREDVNGKAVSIGEAIIYKNDASAVNKDVAALNAVTAEDVSRVLKTYFRENGRTVIYYTGDPKSAEPPVDEPEVDIDSLPSLPFEPEESTPGPADAPDLKLPDVEETTLPNGLKVVVVQRPNVPLVTASLLVKSGAGDESAAKSGLAGMTADLLTKGTEYRNATEIAQQIEFLGATINTGADWNGSSATINVMEDKLDRALSIMSNSVIRPAFMQKEIDLVKKQSLDGFAVSLKEPGSLLNFAAAAYTYGEHPSGGTPQTVKRITRNDIVSFHKKNYVPENSVLIFTGDVSPRTAFGYARLFFGGWEKGQPAMVKTEAIERLSERPPLVSRILVVDLPNSGQAAVGFVNKLSTSRRMSDDEYFSSTVLNSILGGGYSARLNQEIRLKRGLSYGARSGFSQRMTGTNFVAVAQTKTVSAAEVAELIKIEIEKLIKEEVGGDEMTPRKAVVTGGFGRNLQTNNGLARELSNLYIFGLDASELNSFMGGVKQVTPNKIKKFSEDYLYGNDIIIVGDAKDFKADLEKRFPDHKITVVKASDLNLNSPTLR